MDLYAQNILDRYKEPYYRNKEIRVDLENEEANHTCGDKITVKLEIQSAKLSNESKIHNSSFIIHNYSFSGEGCAISQAAADILGDLIIGKNLDEALNITKEELFEALGIDISPRRSKCALLAFETMKGALRNIGKSDNRITDSMIISDIIKINSGASEILEEYGLGCAHCGLGNMETIAEGAKAHGLSEKEIRELIKKLNR